MAATLEAIPPDLSIQLDMQQKRMEKLVQFPTADPIVSLVIKDAGCVGSEPRSVTHPNSFYQ